MLATHRLALVRKQVQSIQTKEQLVQELQVALMLEFSTIPPYLTAMYSLADNTSFAYRTIRSVVLEEMLHMNLVCNLLNSIGVHPSFVQNSEFPAYPTFLPGHKDSKDGPYLQLMPASAALIQNTFMAIEQPPPKDAPPQVDDYQTIAQFYKAIEVGFETVQNNMKPEKLFVDNGCQKTDTYSGSGGGKLFAIHDLRGAKRAIQEIVEQGEGAPASNAPSGPNERWGLYDGYDMRSDGSFGPMVRSTWEQSHYYKFYLIANGTYPLGNVAPMMPNPSVEALDQNPTAQTLARIFNGCYGIMVRGLETAFSTPSTHQPGHPTIDPFFSVPFAMMQSIIPLLSGQLMQLPANPYIDPSIGPNAGPTFRYSDMPLKDIMATAAELKASLVKSGDAPDVVKTLNATLAALADISKPEKFGLAADTGLESFANEKAGQANAQIFSAIFGNRISEL